MTANLIEAHATPCAMHETVHGEPVTATIPYCQLLGASVWCQSAQELADFLGAAMQTVLDSIEALTLVQTDALGEVFRLRELSRT